MTHAGSRTRWTLIEAARDGDDQACQRMVERFQEPVLSFMRRHGAGADAEDLSQEVFLRLFHHGLLEQADPSKGKFRHLVLAVARNVCLAHQSAAKAQKRGGGRVEALGDREPAEHEPDPAFDREWMMRLLTSGLERLRREHPTYHAALESFAIEGRTQAQVAEQLERSPKDVRNHVHRGRAKLVSYLREEAWNYSSSLDDYRTELDYLAKVLGPRA